MGVCARQQPGPNGVGKTSAEWGLETPHSGLGLRRGHQMIAGSAFAWYALLSWSSRTRTGLPVLIVKAPPASH